MEYSKWCQREALFSFSAFQLFSFSAFQLFSSAFRHAEGEKKSGGVHFSRYAAANISGETAA
jgi:hypothetical protein